MRVKTPEYTITTVMPHYYAVKVDGVIVGHTFSHPRCLPRFWSVRLPGTPLGSNERESFKTRAKAAAWLVGMTRECAACNAERGEVCRWGCIGETQR